MNRAVSFLITLVQQPRQQHKKLFKVTKLHQYDWSASTIDKKFQKITDFIHQRLIQHMTNNTKVCPSN